MTDAHWRIVLLLGLSVLLMLCFSLFSRPTTRLYRAVRRVFWASVLLYGTRLLGGPGPGPVNVAAVSCLGAPGLAALLWLYAL